LAEYGKMYDETFKVCVLDYLNKLIGNSRGKWLVVSTW